jgi:SSS family solute:Na+ symporter
LKWDADDPEEFAYLMLANVLITTVAWVSATFVTRPEPLEKLAAFYARVRPAGPGWKPIRALVEVDQRQPTESLAEQFVNWILGCGLIYASLFGIGYLIFKEWAWGAVLTMAALVCGAGISWNLSKLAGRGGSP